MINAVIAALGILFAVTLGYWVQDRNPPMTIHRIEASPSIVTNGGVLRVRYEVERWRRCHVIVEQFVYDKENIRFPVADEDYISEPGLVGPDAFTLAVPVPVAATEGSARYRSLRSYYCNPVHHWFSWPIVVTGDTTFEVIEGRLVRPNERRDPAPRPPE